MLLFAEPLHSQIIGRVMPERLINFVTLFFYNSSTLDESMSNLLGYVKAVLDDDDFGADVQKLQLILMSVRWFYHEYTIDTSNETLIIVRRILAAKVVLESNLPDTTNLDELRVMHREDAAEMAEAIRGEIGDEGVADVMNLLQALAAERNP